MVWNYIKSLFPSEEEMTKKDIELIVNGLVIKLSVTSQSELIFQLLQHREKSIVKAIENLTELQEDKQKLKVRIDLLNSNS